MDTPSESLYDNAWASVRFAPKQIAGWPMNIYLDIDGTLKGTAAPMGDVVAFLEYCLDNHDVYWLTTHCRGGENRTYAALDFLPQSLRDRAFREVSPTDWDVLKTDGIDFEDDFVWFDDDIMQAELEELDANGADRGFFRVETGSPRCLEDALEYAKELAMAVACR